jgi:Amidase
MVMLSMHLILKLALFSLPVFSASIKRNNLEELETTAGGGLKYELGGVTYFANLKYPKTILTGRGITNKESTAPITVIVTSETSVTGKYLKSTVASYLKGDDVFSDDFLESVYISSTTKHGSLDSSALQYLAGLGVKTLYLDSKIFGKSYSHGSLKSVLVSVGHGAGLASGPYTAVVSDGGIKVLTTYRLYRDEYRDFITGAYESNDGKGSYTALEVMYSKFWDPMIPVPSRIYSWGDKRALAGTRVAIKDLYDIKGLQTSGGSQAWITITPTANSSAVAIQRLVRTKCTL